MTDVAQVGVELDAGKAAVVVSIDFASSATGGRVDSVPFEGGELVFGRLATESVGELIACAATGGVEMDPLECVCASLARLFV